MRTRSMFRPLFVGLLAFGMFAQLSACTGTETPQTAVNTAADVASLLVLENSYNDAKLTLTNRLNSFPVQTRNELLALQVKTDALVADFKVAWKSPTSVAQLDQLIARTSQLYDEGKAIVQPILPLLTVEERANLTRLDVAWTRVDAAYQRWQTDPKTQQARQMIQAGMEMATALMLVLG